MVVFSDGVARCCKVAVRPDYDRHRNRKDKAVTGCARNGVVVRLCMDVVIIELQGEGGARFSNDTSIFRLLARGKGMSMRETWVLRGYLPRFEV